MADDRRSLIAPKLPIRGGLSLRRSDERLRADLPVLCLRRRPPTERNPAPNDTCFARELGDPPEPYEVLLHAAMAGDHQYFARRTASRRPGASCSRCSITRPTSAPARAGPGDLRRPKPCSAAARAGSSRGCPRRA